MKKIIASCALGLFLIGFNSVSAQTEKGNFLLGGNLANINLGITEGLGSSFSITPNAGYFVADGFAVGASLPISRSGNSYDGFGGTYKNSSTSIGVGAFARYYFKVGDPLSFFAGLGLGINTYSYKNKFKSDDENVFPSDEDSNSSSDFYSGINVGAAYFISDAVAIEGVLSTSDITEDYLSLNFGVGFKIYFSK